MGEIIRLVFLYLPERYKLGSISNLANSMRSIFQDKNRLDHEGMTSKVNDRWIFLFIYPAIAVLIVHIGNDNTFEKLLHIPSYYSDLLFSLLCTYSIGLYFRWLFRKLDQRFNWDTQMRQRLVRQFVYGILIPIVVVVGAEIMYLELLLNIRISDSSIFYLELPLVGVFCVIVNLIYLMLYYRKHHFLTTVQLKKVNEANNPSGYKSNFVVHAGVRSKNIPADQVSYFVIQGKSTFIVTAKGHQYLYNVPLEKINEDTAPSDFFQLNRQIVAHRKSIVSYERTETRKLKIDLDPKPADPVFVSKIKASEFLKWLDQK